MNILVIGGCHTGNYGVQAHLSFTRQWASHLETAAQEPIHLHCLSMVKLEHIDSLIDQYRANLLAADLIVLQLGHYELSWRQPFSLLFRPGSATSTHKVPVYKSSAMPKPHQSPEKLHKAAHPSQRSLLRDGAKTALLETHRLLYKDIPYLATFRQQLTDAFAKLSTFQEKIVVLTPFPTLNKVDYWLRCQCHSFIIDSAIQRSFTVADSFDAIPRHPAFFLADGAHLNSLGHMVLALFLSELPGVVDRHRELLTV
jgi:hypothetical protein